MCTAALHSSEMKEGSAEEAVASYSHPCFAQLEFGSFLIFFTACLSDFPLPSANITSEEKTVRDKEFCGDSEVAEALKEKAHTQDTKASHLDRESNFSLLLTMLKGAGWSEVHHLGLHSSKGTTYPHREFLKIIQGRFKCGINRSAPDIVRPYSSLLLTLHSHHYRR